jgi:hypothetical protein
LIQRNEARKKINFTFEPKVSLGFLSKSDLEGTGRSVNEVFTGAGGEIGIRKHFSPGFGFRFASGISISPAYSFVEVDTFEVLNPGAAKEDTLPGRMYFSGGTKGYTLLASSTLFWIFGPGLGRVLVEPGIGLIYGMHSETRNTLRGEAGTYDEDLERNFAFGYGAVRASLVFGSSDEINPSVTLELNNAYFRLALGLAYTFYPFF